MRRMDVVVAHSDKDSARKLAESLNNVFRSVHVVGSAQELCAAVARKRAHLAITDLETVGFNDVEELQKVFGVNVVCTHRIPDDQMWAQALSHGALDCCHVADVKSIVAAVGRSSHSHAA